ncbi:MAG TPA: hypothetical protein VGF28_25935 [Thermoanaerobaculia bacterium]|jgi:hypothetical protein
MDDSGEPRVEPVFIAATVAEAELVEQLFEREGIEFEVTPEAYVGGLLSSACLLGILFQVLGGQAPYCRRLLTDAGLARGVVPAGSDAESQF